MTTTAVRDRWSLEETVKALAAAVDAAADAIFCQDLDGMISTWNPAAERLYGYRPDEAMGRQAALLMADEGRAELLAAQATAMAGTVVQRFDTQHAHRDGTLLPVSVTIAPIVVDGQVTALVTTATDIRERIGLANELHAARVELEGRHAALARSNRDLEQFAYVASHDLSEPLRVMTGYCEQLERRYDSLLDDRGRRYLHHIVEASVRMRALIDDLLEYSRFLHAPRELQALDVEAAVAAVGSGLRTQLREADATLEVEALPLVFSDPKQLASLLQNLIGNAVKFSGSDRPPRVRVSGTSDGTWVTLAVDDSGIGIAPEYRERVFRMFQRLHVREAYPGTGIGLTIAQQIVELHGGRIWIEDSPLGGARFCCTLPAAAEGRVS